MGAAVVVAVVGCAATLGGCEDTPEEPVVVDTDDSVCEPGPGRVGLRRLTRAEYSRTVRDSFGVTSAPADVFPLDSATDGFDNNAKGLSTSPQFTKLLFDAAEQVAAEALDNPDAIIFCDPSLDAGCARDTLSALARRRS